MNIAKRLQFYPMLRITLMLILGIIVGQAFYPHIPCILLLIASAIFVAVAFALGKSPLGQTIAICLSFFIFGAFLITRSNDELNIHLPKQEITYQAVLITEPSVHGKVIQTDLLIVGKGKPVKVRATILRDTVSNNWQRLHIGNGITATSILEEPHNFAKSTFDYTKWLRRHGFVAETFIYYRNWRKDRVSLKSLSYFERTAIEAKKIRQHLLSRFHDLGADGNNYAVLAAMILGDKSSLSRDLKDDYSIAGASHVLALSGLHLGIIYAVLSMLTFGFRRKWISQLAIMIAIWSYVFIVGLPTSVVRSAVMLTIISMITIINRRSHLLNSLSVAAFVMLIGNPQSLYDIGFEMSFMAVLGIALFQPLMTPKHLPVNVTQKIIFWLWGMISVSIAAQAGTFPLVVYYFGRFSTYFIITNLIVIPCATIILYGAVATMVMFWWQTAAGLLASVVIACTGFMNEALHWIASLPGASIEGIHWSIVQVIAVYILILAVYIVLRHFQRDPDFNELSASYPQEYHSEEDKSKVDSL